MTLYIIHPSRTEHIPHLIFWKKKFKITHGLVAPSSNIDYLCQQSSFLHLCFPKKKSLFV